MQQLVRATAHLDIIPLEGRTRLTEQPPPNDLSMIQWSFSSMHGCVAQQYAIISCHQQAGNGESTQHAVELPWGRQQCTPSALCMPK
jgi:hypothetical protein